MQEFCEIVELVCTQCGKEFAPTARMPIVRRCPKGSQPSKAPAERKDLACVHRGKGTRTVEAAACCGSKQTLYVWSCSLHGECTKGRAIEGVKSCKTCRDIKP